MPDVHNLKVFAAVAEELSFTRAAETLFLTQSAVSHQVAALERELQTPLFKRQGKKVALTDAGKVLLDRSRRVFQAMEEAEAAVRASAAPGSGRLRIGASSTACQHLLPESLREFRECFPKMSLSITPGDSSDVGERVLDGTIDLGIMIRPETRERAGRLTYHELFWDELGFLVAPLHPWALKGKVVRDQLKEQRLVLYTRGSATFRLIERWFVKAKAPMKDPIELGSMEAIKELVKLGLGVSVMAPWVARQELSQQSLAWLPMPSGRLRRQWTIATVAGRDLGLAEQTFIGLCRAAASNLL